MIVICKACETAFNVDEGLIKTEGSRFKCSKCGHVFMFYPNPESAVDCLEPALEVAGISSSETEAGELDLLDTDPLPIDFPEEYAETEDQNKSVTALDDAGFEPDPDSGIGDSGIILEADDEPEEPANDELPALMDLDEFDEEFALEEDELQNDELSQLESELSLEAEEEISLPADPDDLQETDVLDLSDIQELIESEDFKNAPVEDKIDAVADDPEPVFAGISELIDSGQNSEADFTATAVDDSHIFDIDTLFEETAVEPASIDSDPEIEIFLDPEIGPAEKDDLSRKGPDDDNETDLLFPESEPTDSDGEPGDLTNGFSEPENFGSTPDDFPDDELNATADLNGKTEFIDEIPDQAPPQVIRSRRRIPAIALFSFLIAATGILAASKIAGIKVPYFDEVIKRIPIAGDLIRPENTDAAGNLKLTPLENTVSGEFVQNTSAGRLFVIRGQVLNEYDNPRSFIRITANLYQKGDKLAKTAEVYCGNVIEEQELVAMQISAISKRLRNSFGDSRSNLKLKKGNVVPFMIVFDQLPDNLDEYSVEVAGSTG